MESHSLALFLICSLKIASRSFRYSHGCDSWSILTLFSKSRNYKIAAPKYLPQCSRILGLASLSTRLNHHTARNSTEPRWPPAEGGSPPLQVSEEQTASAGLEAPSQQAGLASPAACAAQCSALSQLLGVSIVNTCRQSRACKLLIWYVPFFLVCQLDCSCRSRPLGPCSRWVHLGLSSSCSFVTSLLKEAKCLK